MLHDAISYQLNNFGQQQLLAKASRAKVNFPSKMSALALADAGCIAQCYNHSTAMQNPQVWCHHVDGLQQLLTWAGRALLHGHKPPHRRQVTETLSTLGIAANPITPGKGSISSSLLTLSLDQLQS